MKDYRRDRTMEIKGSEEVRVNGLKQFYPIFFITVAAILIASKLAFANGFTWERLQAQQDQKTIETLKGISQEISSEAVVEAVKQTALAEVESIR